MGKLKTQNCKWFESIYKIDIENYTYNKIKRMQNDNRFELDSEEKEESFEFGAGAEVQSEMSKPFSAGLISGTGLEKQMSEKKQ